MSRRNENKKFTLIRYRAVIVFMTILVAFLVSIGDKGGRSIASGQSLKAASEKEKKRFIESVRRYPDSFIDLQNFDDVPLYLQKAKVKEIGYTDYVQLTGFNSDSTRYTTFPEVTLTNNTDQRVIGLVLMVGNKQSRKIHGVSLNKISIEPHGSYTVVSTDWVRPERKIQVTASGKVNEQFKPDLDSEKMWFAGAVSDRVLRISAVQFESGNRWQMDPSMDW
jgi:hypothetical protein